MCMTPRFKVDRRSALALSKIDIIVVTTGAVVKDEDIAVGVVGSELIDGRRVNLEGAAHQPIKSNRLIARLLDQEIGEGWRDTNAVDFPGCGVNHAETLLTDDLMHSDHAVEAVHD